MVAKIGAPAPKFKAQAVVNGEIKEISLDDYKASAGGMGLLRDVWGVGPIVLRNAMEGL